MSEQNGQQLLKAISRTQRRLRGQQFLYGLAAVLVVAAVVWLLESVALQFVAVSTGGLLTFNIVLCLHALGLLIYLTLKNTGSDTVALAIDQRADLADRVTSGKEFIALQEPQAIHLAQIKDADAKVALADLPPLFPFASGLFGKRLMAALLMLPLIYAVGLIDLPGLFPDPDAAKELTEEFAEAAPEIPTPILEEVGLSQEVLQLIQPAEELIRQWKDRLRRIEEENRAKESLPESETGELPEAQSPTTPETVMQTSVSRWDKPTRNIQPNMKAQQMRWSDMQSMLDKKADGEYLEAFEYLDKKMFGDNGEQLIDVDKFAEQMAKDAQDQKEGGGALIDGGSMAGQLNTESNKQGAFMNKVQGAQTESMAEFLSEYAAHLMRMTGKMKEIIEQANADVDKQNMPAIHKERYNLVQMGTQTRSIDELTEKDLKDGKLRKLAPDEAGDSRAGYGFGTAEGQYKVPKVERESTLYAELDSQFGEGQSIQILEDLAEGDAAHYAELFQGYALDAETILNSEDIPLAIKNYVREYFMAISPAKVESQTTTDESE